MFRLLLLIAVLMLAGGRASAAPGDIDPAFGRGGSTEFTLMPSDAYHLTTGVQADGRFVSLGTAALPDGPGAAILMRHLPDGRLDASFGTGGRVLLKGETYSYLVPLASGKLALAVSCQPEPISTIPIGPPVAPSDICLTRLNEDGSRDSSFGSAGRVRLGVYASQFAIGATTGGKLVAAWSKYVSSESYSVQIAYLGEDGIPQVRSGGPVGPVYGVDRLLVQGDGKLVLAGVGPGLSALVVRVLADGSPDPGFGAAGSATLPVTIGSNIGMALQPDGRILWGGCAAYPSFGGRLARLTATGALDPSFGGGSPVQPPFWFCDGGFALLPSGNIVVASHKSSVVPEADNFTNSRVLYVTRLTPNGSEEIVGGTTLHQIPITARLDAPVTLIALPDGTLLAGYDAGGPFTLMRFKDDATSVGFGTVTTDTLTGRSGTMLGIGAGADGRITTLFRGDVVRFDANGAINPSGRRVWTIIERLAVQPDGKFLLGYTAGEAYGAFAQRRDSSGNEDTSFGDGGIARVADSVSLRALEALPDGRIGAIVAGPDGAAFATRLTSSGARDTSFASGELVPLAIPGMSHLAGHGMRDLVVAGMLRTSGEPDRFGVIRLVDGAYDSTFGTGGRYLEPALTSPGPHFTGVQRVFVRADRRIVLVANVTSQLPAPAACGGNYSFSTLLVGIDSAGKPDAAIGLRGTLLVRLQGMNTIVWGSALDSAGRIVIAGSREIAGCKGTAFVARFTESGVLDPTFGFGGIRDLPENLVEGVAILPDDALAVLAARAGDLPFAMYRILGGGAVVSVNDSDGDGVPDAVELPLGRVPWVKDNDVFADARLFAMQQYRDFLGREGDATGIQAWTGFIEQGATRESVVDKFLRSPEFEGAMAPVARLYFAYFLRIPDYGGLNFWIGRYRAGNSLEALSNAFATSPEFAATYGALDNAGFVDRVYRNVLGRPPDAGGLAYWKGQLDSAALTRGQLMVAFSESPEYRGLIANEVYVTMMYVGMLRRSPDAGGFAYWVSYMDAGNSSLALTGAFIGAPEYRARFLP